VADNLVAFFSGQPVLTPVELPTRPRKMTDQKR
jgi:hypothetical protein